MQTQDLETRFGKTRVASMLASLRQLEAIHPACFQALISRAVYEEKGAFELPFPKDILQERVNRHTDALDAETAQAIGEDIAQFVLAYVTAEALL